METSRRNGNGEWWRMADIVARILLPITLGITGYVASKAIGNEMRITAIETDRYTIHHRRQDAKELIAMMNSIRADIHRLDLKLASMNPQEWLAEEMDRVVREIRDLKSVLDM